MIKLIRVILFCSLLVFLVQTFAVGAWATGFLKLAVPVISQHINPGENGDNGAYDCTAAAYAMALQTLQTEDKLKQGDFSYSTIRRSMRSIVTNPNEGIDLPIAVALTPQLTTHQAKAEIIQTNQSKWKNLLKEQLLMGNPVIVFLSDWDFLFSRDGGRQHVIVVSAVSDSTVTINDPWDGNSYTVPDETFAYAWGNGNLSWYGVTFTTNPFLLSQK